MKEIVPELVGNMNSNNVSKGVKMKLLRAFIIFIILIFSGLISGQDLSSPESVGMSTERLAKIAPVMQQYIDDGKLAGLATFVARKGQIVHHETYGMADIAAKKPITRETIFRIYSMTKPVTAVAAMILYEEGKLSLKDPVSKHIPAFKNLKVFAGGTMANPVLEDPKEEMRIIDLIRHTAGFTYTRGGTAVDSLYREKAIFHLDDSLEGMINKLAEIPLLYQPGTKYHYSVSIDVLGYVVQVVSGIPFDQFMRERIFQPLKMKDTGFYVPAEKIHRFATRYQLTKDDPLVVGDHPDKSDFGKKSNTPYGGGGLVSTIADYFRFAQMILNKGELDGVRILSRKTVEYMLLDHLPEGERVGPGFGMGIGFGILTDPVEYGRMSTTGSARWSGAANTFFWIDPQEELIFMVWTQLFPYGVYDIRHKFKIMAQAAIID